MSEHSSICASDWLTCHYPHLWLVSLLSAQVSVCPPVWAWCLNAKWISLQIVSRGWQQKSSLKMDTNISIRTLSWTHDTRESNLNTAGIEPWGHTNTMILGIKWPHSSDLRSWTLFSLFTSAGVNRNAGSVGTVWSVPWSLTSPYDKCVWCVRR